MHEPSQIGFYFWSRCPALEEQLSVRLSVSELPIAQSRTDLRLFDKARVDPGELWCRACRFESLAVKPEKGASVSRYGELKASAITSTY